MHKFGPITCIFLRKNERRPIFVSDVRHMRLNFMNELYAVCIPYTLNAHARYAYIRCGFMHRRSCLRAKFMTEGNSCPQDNSSAALPSDSVRRPPRQGRVKTCVTGSIHSQRRMVRVGSARSVFETKRIHAAAPQCMCLEHSSFLFHCCDI